MSCAHHNPELANFGEDNLEGTPVVPVELEEQDHSILEMKEKYISILKKIDNFGTKALEGTFLEGAFNMFKSPANKIQNIIDKE